LLESLWCFATPVYSPDRAADGLIPSDLLLKVCGSSDGRTVIGWQTDTVDSQPAPLLLLLRVLPSILMDAGPCPVLGSSDPAAANRVEMKILNGLIIFLDGAQRAAIGCWW